MKILVENYIIFKEREIIIFDDGSTKEGKWKIVERRQKIKPRKLIRTTKEHKTIKRQGFRNTTYELETGLIFKTTHHIPTTEAYDYDVKLERDRLEYDNGDIQFTDWSEC